MSNSPISGIRSVSGSAIQPPRRRASRIRARPPSLAVGEPGTSARAPEGRATTALKRGGNDESRYYMPRRLAPQRLPAVVSVGRTGNARPRPGGTRYTARLVASSRPRVSTGRPRPGGTRYTARLVASSRPRVSTGRPRPGGTRYVSRLAPRASTPARAPEGRATPPVSSRPRVLASPPPAAPRRDALRCRVVLRGLHLSVSSRHRPGFGYNIPIRWCWRSGIVYDGLALGPRFLCACWQ